jgi:hypothetical protein
MQIRKLYLWNAQIYGRGGLVAVIVIAAVDKNNARAIMQAWIGETLSGAGVNGYKLSRKLRQREKAWVVSEV